jgi:hypothetical protein
MGLADDRVHSHVDVPYWTLVIGDSVSPESPRPLRPSEAPGGTDAKPIVFKGLPRTESDMAKTKKAAVTKAIDVGRTRTSARPPAAAKPGPAKPGAPGKEDGATGKRKLGLRGAAPWAARHAAKHAAEARARAAEPPLPGSARATIRTPENAEDIKQKVRDLHAALAQIKTFRKALPKTFYDIGLVLRDIQTRRLYEAKRFPSFEAFVEREIDLGKTTALRLVRVTVLFVKEGALEVGMDKLFAALTAMDSAGEPEVSRIPPAPVSTTALPLRPPGR